MGILSACEGRENHSRHRCVRGQQAQQPRRARHTSAVYALPVAMEVATVSGVVAEAELLPLSPGGVPKRVAALFTKFDSDGDGHLTLAEWKKAVALEFPKLPPAAAKHVEPSFEKYSKTTADHPEKFVDVAAFSKMYAGFLFKNFDVDGNGSLDAAEAQEALKYLTSGVELRLAIPLQKDPTGKDTMVSVACMRGCMHVCTQIKSGGKLSSLRGGY